MKLLKVIACSVVLFFTLLTLKAQVYPYWDAAHPGMADGDGGYYDGPIVAYEDAVYAVLWGGGGTGNIAYWTPYSGSWQTLTNLQVWKYYSGTVHATPMMTIHDHYLYVVGFFTIGTDTNPVDYSDLSKSAPNFDRDNYTNRIQIARYDLWGGGWSRIGQSFTAKNVVCPTCIAIDTNNWIYVGFDTDFYSTNTFPSLTIDMLDVSTNGGTNWSAVGTNLVVPFVNTHVYTYTDWPEVGDTTYEVEAGISALHADGADLYIGGDFAGSGDLISSNLIKWDGSTWHSFGTSGRGLGISAYDLNNGGFGIDTVNAIETIGTNVFVAGNFYYPTRCFARFSSVTGVSLPIGDPGPAGYMNWNGEYMGGLCLAINNGNLYFGGYPIDSTSTGYLAVCTNPTGSVPSWNTNLVADYPSDTLYSTGTSFLASDPNGNAVFTMANFVGQDASTNSSNGSSRLVVSADVTPSASIVSVDYSWPDSATARLSITGSPDRTWQVQDSEDGTNWTTIGIATLSGGSASFTNFPDDKSLFYRLYHDGLTSPTNCDDTLTLSVTNPYSVIVYVALYGNDELIEDGLEVDANSSQTFTFSGQSAGVNYTINVGDAGYIYVQFSDNWLGFMDTVDISLPDEGGDNEGFIESGNLLCPGD